MRIAITQPTYLPWLGYFDLIDQVQQLVLLDTVQFEKRSWQQRNQIRGPNGLQWLSIPVASRGRRSQLIKDAEILDPGFWADHVSTLKLYYRRSPYFGEYIDELSSIMQTESARNNLAGLTIALIRWLASAIGFSTPIVRSSELAAHGKRTELLAEICTSLGANEYLSPLGSSAYLLDEMATMTSRGIAVRFQNYEHPAYRQMFAPFEPYACVLDLLFNEGPNAGSIIRSGRRPSLLPEDVAAHIRDLRSKNNGHRPGEQSVC